MLLILKIREKIHSRFSNRRVACILMCSFKRAVFDLAEVMNAIAGALCVLYIYLLRITKKNCHVNFSALYVMKTNISVSYGIKVTISF